MKYVHILFILLLSMNPSFSQSNYQYFRSEGFKLKCECQMKVNNTFIQMSKQQGQHDLISAFTCSVYNGSVEYGKIFNLNISDLSSSYIGLNISTFSLFEKEYLKKYATFLASNNLEYEFVTYKGLSAVVYSFNQNNLPTKAIIFLKNKKSYLLQVGTQNNLQSSFNLFKNSFSFY